MRTLRNDGRPVSSRAAATIGLALLIAGSVVLPFVAAAPAAPEAPAPPALPAASAALAAPPSAGVQALALSEFVRVDPAKIVGPERCGECHSSEHGVWSQTLHATGFDTLHRKESAAQIAAAMGFRLIKRESLCLKCHYTPEVERGQLRAAEGVSCESCHGAARDWVEVHADYGVRDADLRAARNRETPEHREQRIAAARANGMRRPSDLYGVAANCFECHTVPHEELVNVGGHSTGSAAFELVAWSQGEMRHDFLQSFLTGDGSENAESSPQRRRQMYVVGKALELEYLLRGVALATEPGKYLSALVRRKRRVIGDLQEIGGLAALPEVDEMLSIAAGADLRPGNGAALEASADRLRELTRAFIANHDGALLAALDPLYQRTGVTDAGAADDAPAAGPGGDAAAPAAAGTPPASGIPASGAATRPATSVSTPNPTAPAAGGRAGAATPAGGAAPAAPLGAIQTWPSWRPLPRHANVRDVPCTGCHEHVDQVSWWYEDRHSRAADPLLDEKPEYLRIAVAYGIGADAMTRGDQLCMQCHGTYTADRASRSVTTGVECQRCHGPGADYKDIHQQNREQALASGMLALRNPAVHAATCADCHYVTDPRLISVGHPTGADFDVVAASASIKHWATDPEAGALRSAFAGVIAARGPLPSAALAAAAARASAAGAAGGAEARSPGDQNAPGGRESAAGTAGGEIPVPQVPLTAAGGAPPAAAGAGAQRQRANAGANPPGASEDVSVGARRASLPDGSLPPLVVPDNASVEDILLLIKQRLDLLYRLVGRRR